MERLTRARGILLLVLFCLIVGFFALRLYNLQIVETEGKTDNTKYFTTITRVKAARGEILDRNGNVLVTNRASYDMVINHYVLLSASGTNNHLLALVQRCREMEIDYNDHFPVSDTAPFTYTLDDYNSAWQGYFRDFLSAKGGLDSDITAPLLISTLRSAYKIPAEWSDEDARAVIGLRYEMDLRQDITNLPLFVFLEDASTDELSALLELSVPGLSTEASTVREYSSTYASHILGYIGAMTPAQWEKYKTVDGYSMDALVGQTGLEAAFEEYLHGTDGYRVDKVTSDGTVVEQYYRVVDGVEQRPISGQNVELTIDLDLQAAAESTMAEVFANLTARGEEEAGHDAEGGAVVAMDIKTGQVLVCASYPTYDLSTFFENYEEIKNADFGPLYNRALIATYPPGSIYKLSMVIAGIDDGIINGGTQIHDHGIFTTYLADGGFAPKCLAYTLSAGTYTHGAINASEALMYSCNYFFYELADRMGLSVIDRTAKGLGLGEATGIELYEELGYRANEETKAKLHSGNDAHWYQADQIMCGIGQSDNMFTPMQMCVYLSTIVNQGVRYKATFLNRVLSSDYRESVLENPSQIMSTFEVSDEAYRVVTTGMRSAVTSPVGTASYFRTYPYEVAAKTGTAEHGAGGSDHGSFVVYGPYEDPQIAIAVYGEKCGGGSLMAPVAEAILDVFFGNLASGDDLAGENQIT